MLTLTSFISLDGVMQGPGGPGEDTRFGFKHGGWVSPFVADPGFGEVIDKRFRSASAFLLGRRTFDIFANYWPKVTDTNDVVANTLNTLPKYAVSTTLDSPKWNNTHVVKGDVVARIKALKDEYKDGQLQVHGSCDFAQTLIANDLVDLYELFVFPVTLGQGIKLFGAGTQATTLELISSKACSNGLVINHFERGGELKTFTIGE